MHLYVPNDQVARFLENLKVLPLIDDYHLDREHLGKSMVKVNYRCDFFKLIQELLVFLPSNSMIVCDTNNPGDEYLLCIGETQPDQIHQLNEDYYKFSILTKFEDKIRFNTWVKLSNLYELHNNENLNKLTTINSKIEDVSYFEISSSDVNELFLNASNFSNELIINNNSLLVKLSLMDFKDFYNTNKELIGQVTINDMEDW